MAPAGKQSTDRCMGFSKGKLGAAVVVLAIMASILMGYFASIDGEERTYTDYNYITDVSGLFNYSDTPQYIEYDPASNYTGYYQNDVQMGGLNYTLSELANNFRITIEKDPTSGSISMSSIGLDNWNKTDVANTTKPAYITTYVSWSEFVSKLALPEGTSTVHFTKDPDELPLLTRFSITTQETSPSKNVINGYNSVYNLKTQTLETYTVDGVKDGTWNTNELYVVLRAPSQSINESPPYTFYSLSTNYTAYPEPDIFYMNPSDGVTLNSTSPVQWGNTYINGVISHVLRANAWTDSSMTMTYTAQDNTFSSVTVETSSDGWSISVDHGEAVDIGKWKTIELTYDALNGEVTVTPVKTFYTFMDYTLYDSPTYDIGEGIQSPITGISLTGDGKANITFSVGTTDVFLNTYGAVMLDPSLNIFEYFTQYEKLRLNLYSFAIYGESITLNGVTYPVTAGQITVDGKAHDLQNIYITYADGHMSLTFVNDSATYDLGEYTDPTISFAGNWYFTTGLWEPYTATETVYDWTPGLFSASAPQLLIIFLGLVVAGLLIARRYYRPRLTDYAIIIGTAFVAVVVLGVF